MFIAKVVEAAALDQFVSYCDENVLIPDYQSAYRKNYSCETALLNFVSDLLWVMERGDVTAVITLDLSVAFDTVDHKILAQALNQYYGASGPVLQWYKSYLSSQSLKVCVNGSYSNEQALTFSVPQGLVEV